MSHMEEKWEREEGKGEEMKKGREGRAKKTCNNAAISKYHNSGNFHIIIIFKFSSELIFVGGTSWQYTWQYKFKFSGKLIFVEGTTFEN